MTESILGWMRKTEKRFSTNFAPLNKENSIFNANTKESLNFTSKISKNQRNTDEIIPQKTLDSFLPKIKKSKIFDGSFGLEDFKLLTRRWREKNTVSN
jgi:hypothetical protein